VIPNQLALKGETVMKKSMITLLTIGFVLLGMVGMANALRFTEEFDFRDSSANWLNVNAGERAIFRFDLTSATDATLPGLNNWADVFTSGNSRVAGSLREATLDETTFDPALYNFNGGNIFLRINGRDSNSEPVQTEGFRLQVTQYVGNAPVYNQLVPASMIGKNAQFVIPLESAWIMDDGELVTIVKALNFEGNDFSVKLAKLNVDVAPVPEPATMILFGAGLAVIVGSRFRRKK